MRTGPVHAWRRRVGEEFFICAFSESERSAIPWRDALDLATQLGYREPHELDEF